MLYLFPIHTYFYFPEKLILPSVQQHYNCHQFFNEGKSKNWR